MVESEHHFATSKSRPAGLRCALAVLAVLALIGALAGCGASPSADAQAQLPSPTATPSPWPTLTALPTVPAAATSGAGRGTVPASPGASPTPTASATLTPEPAETRAPTPDLAAPASPTPVPTAVLTQDVVHILLIGGDTGSNAPDQNTDVLIVVSINRRTDQVTLLSIPRDLWVYIPTWGYGRINTAHRIGARTKYAGFGPGLLTRTIEENLGIPIDHWVRVDYQGFAHAVDVLGGIDVTVACPTDLRYNGDNPTALSGEVLQPGVHHLDGATALRYVRTRRGESDFVRARRQQQFLKSVWDQMRSPDILLKIPGLWSALNDSFKTDLNLGQVLALAPLALDLQRNQVHSRYIGRDQVQNWTTPEGAAVLLPIPEEIEKVVAALDAPPAAGQDGATAEQARIQVRNGTHRAFLDVIAADQVRWLGLEVADTGSADRPDYGQTRIVVYRDKPTTLAKLVDQFQVQPANVVRQPDPDAAADLLLILGEDYDPCR